MEQGVLGPHAEEREQGAVGLERRGRHGDRAGIGREQRDDGPREGHERRGRTRAEERRPQCRHLDAPPTDGRTCRPRSDAHRNKTPAASKPAPPGPIRPIQAKKVERAHAPYTIL